MSVVLHRCETSSLTLREEHSLRVFQNRVLRRIFGLKRDELTGVWSKLHNEELHNLYSSPDIIRQNKSRRMRSAGHVARIRGEEIVLGFGGKSRRKEPLCRPRHRWEDGIRTNLREIGWGVDWIQLPHDRDRWRAVVNAVMKLRLLALRIYLVAYTCTIDT
jgi:hypothetical protein